MTILTQCFATIYRAPKGNLIGLSNLQYSSQPFRRLERAIIWDLSKTINKHDKTSFEIVAHENRKVRLQLNGKHTTHKSSYLCTKNGKWVAIMG